MFFNDILLVRESIAKYGLQLPFVDLGGLHAKDITVAQYDLTIQRVRNGESPTSREVQYCRYIHLDKDPFFDIAGDYAVLNPQYGDPPIERLCETYPEAFGTIVCLSVLEHVEDPFEVFGGFRKLLKPEGLLILSTEQSFPPHDVPRDFWRFTDDALRYLAGRANLKVLEAGYRLNIHGGMGVLNIQDMKTPQEIRSVYVVARK